MLNATENHTVIDAYLSDIDRYKPLTRTEEKDLIAPLLNPSITHAEAQTIRATLVLHHLRFVVYIAKEYRNAQTVIGFQDLINAGNIGCIQASERFDPAKGLRFFSFAVHWVRNAIRRQFSELGHGLRYPVNVLKDYYKVQHYRADEEQKRGRFLDISECGPAEVTAYGLSMVGQMARYIQSMESPMSKDPNSSTLREMLPSSSPSPEDITVDEERKDFMRLLYARIEDEKEKAVIGMYYGFVYAEPMTLEEIGKELKLTRERVRQIRNKALKRLRKPAERFTQGRAQLAV